MPEGTSQARFVAINGPPGEAPPACSAGLGFLAAALGDISDTHRQGREELEEGYRSAMGEGYTPTLAELQAFGAIATLESHYGRGWSGPMAGSNNWGAITCGSQPDAEGNCPAGCSPNKDSSPYSGEYVTCFRRWATPADGAAGLINFIYKWPEVQDAIKSGNLDDVSWTMRQRSYYLGTNPEPREAARTHAGALDKHAQAIAAAMGEPIQAWRKGEDWTPGDDADDGVLVNGDEAGTQDGGGLLLVGLVAAGGVVALWKLGLLDRLLKLWPR